MKYPAVQFKTPCQCGSCGATFFDTHICPTRPTSTLPVTPVRIHIPTITVRP